MHTLTLWVLNINEGRKAVDLNLNVSSSVTGLYIVVPIFIAVCVVVKHTFNTQRLVVFFTFSPIVWCRGCLKLLCYPCVDVAQERI